MGGSSIIKVAWYWSSLWRSCFTDSTAVSNCYDYPVLWSVEGHIQIVRGLLMAGLTLGMLGFVLSLMGMECTFIGGKERAKYRKIYAGGWCHITSGLLSACGYVVYAEYVSVEYFNPDFDGLKYDLGTPLFLGWVGSAFHMTGGFFYVWSVCKPLCGEDTVINIRALPEPGKNPSTTALSTVSEITSKTKVLSVSEISSKTGSSEIKGMWRRLAQILGLMLAILGWGLVACTLAMDHWRVAQLGGQGGSSVVVTAWYWSNLWKDCYEDSTTLVNCVDFGVLWKVKLYIQAVQGLLMNGLCLGLIGSVLTFFGMECTHIGGDQRTKDKILITSFAFHLVGSVSDMAGYCLYINRVAAVFLHAKADPSKLSYDIGTPLYLGLVGSFFILFGCTLYCATACRATHPKRCPTVPFIRVENGIYRKSACSNDSSDFNMASTKIVIV
ncbi:hypothetical protein LDENG_00090150 [Lucifuga dentata]|nr:hypothetical protein LDENG_00090150 [Lucifuga dentata]